MIMWALVLAIGGGTVIVGDYPSPTLCASAGTEANSNRSRKDDLVSFTCVPRMVGRYSLQFPGLESK